MSKIIALFLIAAMAVQIIKPIGLPGLKKRMDFWKIALGALVITVVVLFIRPS